jgi:hypothetical protein
MAGIIDGELVELTHQLRNHLKLLPPRRSLVVKIQANQQTGCIRSGY